MLLFIVFFNPDNFDEQKTINVLKTDENYEVPGKPLLLENSSPELRKVRRTITLNTNFMLC